MGENVFSGRSLCVIDDFSVQERQYLFSRTKELKDAIVEGREDRADVFRINDQDYGIYEVFLEDSTRTRESFRNAAKFHHVKVSELNVDSSSFTKGESFADTFNTLCGYSNAIFIIRSKVEGVCRWLEQECTDYARRNGLPYTPVFINAGDGKHEHPTQELLDEFTFLEDNLWSTENIHLALVGDLFHGRTVHSKANGLTLWKNVKVDLIAPKELSMPASYVVKMKENGFDVRSFSSLEEYLAQDDIAPKWYFTRPQLERMGERILKRQDELRASITFRKEWLDVIDPATRFYHPLPRHKEHPTIPTFLDATPFNAWERQSINGMYVRMVLLSFVSGRIGEDFIPPVHETKTEAEDYIVKVSLEGKEGKPKQYSEGVKPLHDGIVIDHICTGDTPSEIREHMRRISRVLDLDDGRGGEWISCGEDGRFKGILFRPEVAPLPRKSLKRLAAVAPGCTLNIISGAKITEKYRMRMPPRIYNFDDLGCTNTACISHESLHEGVPAMFRRTADDKFECAWCDTVHGFKEIWKGAMARDKREEA
ncbi:aspartate carbamoyltransferase [Parasphaerochaeta coccoides]|uniref:Aspartate carbamoyltransferase n=1 Tax=Parasphaerochaeta coccoides (strain ATCC BAA-1237 / DSM 17374 / SPN1) TaxID=760011 RepID=F4GJI6_PARC1|nr:aspartate carbamoyltransferase [Parasphaerochaeta coccoides]AEC02251.1 aspartate carbamoyltransferase [Parasphaerochaeta coccoides DSM 17374]